jgi:arylsulfatase A-like enzyme
MASNSARKPNIVMLAIDSLRADHMSCYGYRRHTTPHMDRLAAGGTLYRNHFSPHIPTTSGYASMLTGLDCFGTQVVALRHRGGLRPEIRTLPEILAAAGYQTSCVGFGGNPASRGFQTYVEFSGWGSWEAGRSPKAENLNNVALPELDRLAADEAPFLLFLRHMDPHSPYLPPAPYERMFYHGDPCDPSNHSMDACMTFKPFCDYFAAWLPPGISDAAYVVSQYDGAVAYMDASIKSIFNALEAKGIVDETIIVITSDHGETLDEHECWFDHHGMYDNVLHVPFILRYPGKVPAGKVVEGFSTHQDVVPTLLELAEIEVEDPFTGTSALDMARGEVASHACEFYHTECTWMRKHGWRTPHWKLHWALEPDFHFKPEIELYNLVEDPAENHNVAAERPDVVALLKAKIEAWVAKREAETGLPAPIHNQGDWHGIEGIGPFKTSQQAYDTLHIGDPGQAAKLQAESRK